MLQFTPSLEPEHLPWAEIIEENPAEGGPAESMPQFHGLTDIEIKALLTVVRPPKAYQCIAAFVLGLVVTVMVVSSVPLLRPDPSDDFTDANAMGLLLLLAAWLVAVVGMILAFGGLRPRGPGRCLAALGLVLNAPLALAPHVLVLRAFCLSLLR